MKRRRWSRVTCTRLHIKGWKYWKQKSASNGSRNDRSASPESCGCLQRATRNISLRSFASMNERAPLRWGVIYVAEGGNCPRILCPACPRGHTFQPAVSTVNNVPRVVPKRFLVSAVILAINRRLLPLKYRVSCLPSFSFSLPSAYIVCSVVRLFVRSFVRTFVPLPASFFSFLLSRKFLCSPGTCDQRREWRRF